MSDPSRPAPAAGRDVLFDTQFELTGEGGGQRRASQIAGLIGRAGFGVSHLAAADLYACPEFRRGAVWAAAAVRTARLPVRRSWRAVKPCLIAALAYRARLAGHAGPRVLVRERTRGVGKLATTIAHAVGYHTVVLPQNFEALVPDQTDPLLRPLCRATAVADEAWRLGQDDKVFCIAREEQWLLTAHGVPADYLPYYPPEDWAEDLLKVRADRRPPARPRLLVLGSVSNPPVRAGVVEIARRAAPLVDRAGGELHVAGNDTEHLRGQVPAGVIVHGRVSAGELGDLLATASAALVYQARGCGALTKVPELLLAGVPVVANGVAARSAYHYSGVHLFETDAELAGLIGRKLPTPPVPARPTQEEGRFVDVLRALAGVNA